MFHVKHFVKISFFLFFQTLVQILILYPRSLPSKHRPIIHYPIKHRELFDEKVIYENDCFQTYYGAYDGKSFKKVFKAMSVGSGCRFYAGGEEGSPAWFSFIGKDGYKVDGILGYLNAYFIPLKHALASKRTMRLNR